MEINSVTIFWLQIALSILVFSTAAAWYLWPLLRTKTLNSALIPLVAVHVMRYVGMTLLVPGMIDPKLPNDFLAGAAYGDLLAAALASMSILSLRYGWRLSIPLVWVFNTWGFVDLLNGLRGTIMLNVPSFSLNTVWYIYTFYAPAVAVSHVLIFWILATQKSWKN